MLGNTGLYWDKVSGNIAERRIHAGKKGGYFETFTQGPASTRILDLSGVLLGGNDGISCGTIDNQGVDEIKVSLNCRDDETIPYPEITIKPTDEPFDLCLNGKIKKIVVRNPVIGDAIYTITGV